MCVMLKRVEIILMLKLMGIKFQSFNVIQPSQRDKKGIENIYRGDDKIEKHILILKSA